MKKLNIFKLITCRTLLQLKNNLNVIFEQSLSVFIGVPFTLHINKVHKANTILIFKWNLQQYKYLLPDTLDIENLRFYNLSKTL